MLWRPQNYNQYRPSPSPFHLIIWPCLIEIAIKTDFKRTSATKLCKSLYALAPHLTDLNGNADSFIFFVPCRATPSEDDGGCGFCVPWQCCSSHECYIVASSQAKRHKSWSTYQYQVWKADVQQWREKWAENALQEENSCRLHHRSISALIQSIFWCVNLMVYLWPALLVRSTTNTEHMGGGGTGGCVSCVLIQLEADSWFISLVKQLMGVTIIYGEHRFHCWLRSRYGTDDLLILWPSFVHQKE